MGEIPKVEKAKIPPSEELIERYMEETKGIKEKAESILSKDGLRVLQLYKLMELRSQYEEGIVYKAYKAFRGEVPDTLNKAVEESWKYFIDRGERLLDEVDEFKKVSEEEKAKMPPLERERLELEVKAYDRTWMREAQEIRVNTSLADKLRIRDEVATAKDESLKEYLALKEKEEREKGGKE